MKEKQTIFKGDNGKYGVGGVNSVLYDALFSKKVATRIAALVNSNNPPKDWEATETILQSEGLL